MNNSHRLFVCRAIVSVIDHPYLALTWPRPQGVCGAADASTASVQDMGVNHCRANVFVAEQFLHGANVVAVRQKVCGEGVPAVGYIRMSTDRQEHSSKRQRAEIEQLADRELYDDQDKFVRRVSIRTVRTRRSTSNGSKRSS